MRYICAICDVITRLLHHNRTTDQQSCIEQTYQKNGKAEYHKQANKRIIQLEKTNKPARKNE